MHTTFGQFLVATIIATSTVSGFSLGATGTEVARIAVPVLALAAPAHGLPAIIARVPHRKGTKTIPRSPKGGFNPGPGEEIVEEDIIDTEEELKLKARAPQDFDETIDESEEFTEDFFKKLLTRQDFDETIDESEEFTEDFFKKVKARAPQGSFEPGPDEEIVDEEIDEFDEPAPPPKKAAAASAANKGAAAKKAAAKKAAAAAAQADTTTEEDITGADDFGGFDDFFKVKARSPQGGFNPGPGEEIEEEEEIDTEEEFKVKARGLAGRRGNSRMVARKPKGGFELGPGEQIEEEDIIDTEEELKRR